MPLYDFCCTKCGSCFEDLMKKPEDATVCPRCGGVAVRVWSGTMHSATGKPPKKCSGHCSTCSGCK